MSKYSNSNRINLSTKKITDFTEEDTIYIRLYYWKPVYLCQYIKYDSSKAIVTGMVISVAYDYENGMIGKTISARLYDCALFGNATTEENRSPYFRWFDRSLYAMHPMEEHKVFENDVHVSKHPSYGLARFSRISGGHRALFGSSIQSQQTIILTISRAEHDRSLNKDWYHSKGELIEIEMSNNQFAELMTSFNMGSGIPVTIKHINHEMYPDAPFQAKGDIFSAEFQKQMHNYGVEMKKTIETATDILTNKANIGKGDRDVILKSLDRLVTHVTNSIPFVADQFREQMDKTVVEAKSEVEAFIEHKIRSTGMEALGYKKENYPLLENSDTDQK